MPMYKQYEDCFKLIFWYFLFSGEDLLSLWDETSGTCILFLVYVLASHLASFTPHQLSEGIKALILHDQRNSTWNDTPEKLWDFVRNGGLGQFLDEEGTREGSRQALQEMADRLANVTSDLQWSKLRTCSGSELCSMSEIGHFACYKAWNDLKELGIKEHFPELKPEHCKRKWEEADASQLHTEAKMDSEQALQCKVQKANASASGP